MIKLAIKQSVKDKMPLTSISKIYENIFYNLI